MQQNRKSEISLCIPTFNRSEYLDYLLGHLFEQSDSIDFEYEILISNNASTDNTSEIVEKWNNKLPIRFFEQKKNIGASANLFFLFEQVVSEFTLYVADDDSINLKELEKCLEEGRSRPDVGILFTPWKIGLPDKTDALQFYSHPENILIRKGQFPNLLATILKYHIFPEIFIVKTKVFRELSPLTRENIVYDYFSIISECVNHFDVFFSTTVFYTSITNHPAGSRIQRGHEQAKYIWDSYRGGLELMLGQAIHSISNNEAMTFRENINLFIAQRLTVAIKLRLYDKSDWLETYFIACRLRGLGLEKGLPLPFTQIATLAAIEYIVQRTIGKKIDSVFLIGNYDTNVADLFRNEFKFKNTKILDEPPKNPKNSIIFYQNEQTFNGMRNNSVDYDGNHYFSEHILMNVKFK